MAEELPQIVTKKAEARNFIRAARESRKRIGLVPTMGALHEGHLSLVRAAQKACDCVVVTIFVNPAQFSPSEDLSKYPRTIEEDLEALRELGVDIVFMPDRDELYPTGFSTYVLPPAVADPFEGQYRPEHFRGVATVVLKLFNVLPADVAFFGQKDFQQCQVIRRMVEDLDIPIGIQLCPIIREPDGLAMSSRNRYLSPDEREQAVAISGALAEAKRCVEDGATNSSMIVECMGEFLRKAEVRRIDYAVVADASTLQIVDRIERPAVALIAAYIGQTRLIDNTLLAVENAEII